MLQQWKANNGLPRSMGFCCHYSCVKLTLLTASSHALTGLWDLWKRLIYLHSGASVSGLASRDPWTGANVSALRSREELPQQSTCCLPGLCNVLSQNNFDIFLITILPSSSDLLSALKLSKLRHKRLTMLLKSPWRALKCYIKQTKWIQEQVCFGVREEQGKLS